MRDDLHRTVALPRSWKRVLKLASIPADFDRARSAMTRAINAEFVAEVGKPWLRSLKTTLAAEGWDLFDHERPIRTIEDFGRKNLTVLQRRLVENMTGLIARGVVGEALLETAIDSVCHQLADARIAQTTSLVSQLTGDQDAHFVERKLSKLAQSCKFTMLVAKRTPHSAADALDLVITATSVGEA